ncbi:Chaperone protein dnaJ 8, chloroplastic [Apostasia shenzhenica]|uniref:Chaperone protein dnaJ 8, chloroplastic n=1 Tax=Apostasia shenzhenica TaxID=1088818 RepID=A0A2I0AK90_9ASPA|nr:Chaperone protein dnaJ 8, chloroplastic [Apostasia shenzhenica]
MWKAATPRRWGRGPMRDGAWMPARSPEICHRIRFQARSLPFSSEFAMLGLAPFASKSDVKQAYKRLALKGDFLIVVACRTESVNLASPLHHPDVLRGENVAYDKEEIFREIKSAYEILMTKFEEEEKLSTSANFADEWDEWDEWMGFEGGLPTLYNPL